MEQRRCSRCKETKDVCLFAPTSGYCRPCSTEYARDHYRKKKTQRDEWIVNTRHQHPYDLQRDKTVQKKTEQKPAVKQKTAAKPKRVQLVIAPSQRNSRKYADMINPAKPCPSDGAETIAQWIARGGSVDQVPAGATGNRGNSNGA